MRLVLLLSLFAVAACADAPAPATDAPGAATAVRGCFDDAGGDLDDLDAAVDDADGAPEPLVRRGLCYWARWSETGEAGDAEAAYDDLTAAIDAIESGATAVTPLDVVYSHRAFVARALDDGWVRTLEDLGRAVALDPDEPRHVLDRGVVRSYVGDSARARADLRQYLALADSADVTDAQKRVAERLLEDWE